MSKTKTFTQENAADMLTSVNADQLSEAIKAVGCAVTPIEQDGAVHLHSASHGVGFQVLWGNSRGDGQYADFTFSCPLRVQGKDLPDSLLPEWHRTKRFARASQHGDFVVLEMDVVIAGGVSPQHLAVAAQIWTQMMGQFFLYLRNFRSAGPVAANQEGATTDQAGADA